MLSNSIKNTFSQYPRQFWLLFGGMLISTTGTSMIWPFQTIYASQKLGLPLTSIATLLTINAFCAMASSFIFSPLIDRTGRKWPMIIGLLTHAISLLMLSQADTYLSFALLMGLNGIVNPIYRIAADAMLADLVPPTKRIDGYALLRLSNNLGISVGPAIGGFLAAVSYNYIFFGGAAGLFSYGMLLILLGKETLPQLAQTAESIAANMQERFGGFGRVLKDGPFIQFVINFVLVHFCAVLIWQFMPIYAMTNFPVSESQYGLIPTTNAAMVVLLQVGITSISKKHPPLLVMALGALLYALATGAIAASTGFWGFWMCMVAMTFGELLLVPTSSTYAANLAPADMRARYMGIYGLSWSAAGMVAPLMGGILNDQVGLRAPWLAGMLVGLLAVVGYAARYFHLRRIPPAAEETAR